MYHRQNANNDKPFQTIQLSSLKKKNTTNILTSQNNKLILNTNEQPLNILTILALYHFISSSQTAIDQQIFKLISFEQCPKAYQSYSHQKTMKVLLKIVIDNSQSEKLLVQLVNEYPILGFVLEAYCRAACINFIKNRKDCQGSEKEMLENFAIDFRGNMLDLIADCLEMHVTLTCGQIMQSYGQQKQVKKVQINITENGLQAQFINRKSTYPKINQISSIKTLKHINTQQTQPSQSQQVSTIQTNSLLKDNLSSSQLGKCDKCRMKKSKCYCSKKIIGSAYGTPSSATKFQRTSINAGIAASIIATMSNQQASMNQVKGRCTCNKVFCTCNRR